MNSVDVIFAFEEFLNEHNALEPLRTQLRKGVYCDSDDLHEYIRNLLSMKGTVKDAINFAFTWDSTKEGNLFWSNLHKIWLKKVETGNSSPKAYNTVW